MNAPPRIPPTTTTSTATIISPPTLSSLPRNLPPKVAAASLAATLRGARRRRLRRQTGQVCTAVILGFAAALGLQGMGGSQPAGPGRSAFLADQISQAKGPDSASEPERPHPPETALPDQTLVLRTKVLPHRSPVAAPSSSPLNEHPAPAPAAPPADQSPAASSFVLVRSRPAGTPPPSTEGQMPQYSPQGESPGFVIVSTASIPAPMVITTARSVPGRSIATADQPQAPENASDADLFAYAQGRPAALCRPDSGPARWLWLDGVTRLQ